MERDGGGVRAIARNADGRQGLDGVRVDTELDQGGGAEFGPIGVAAEIGAGGNGPAGDEDLAVMIARELGQCCLQRVIGDPSFDHEDIAGDWIVYREEPVRLADTEYDEYDSEEQQEEPTPQGR